MGVDTATDRFDVQSGDEVVARDAARVESQRLAQGEAPGHGRDQVGRGLHEDRRGPAFGGAVEAMPVGSRRAAQGALGEAAEVEDDDGVVAVAYEHVGRGEGGGHRARAHPDEVAQVVEGHAVRRKAVGGIDQGHALPGLAGGVEDAGEDGLSAGAGCRGNQLGQPTGWQAAAEGIVNGRDAGGHAVARPPRRRGEA